MKNTEDAVSKGSHQVLPPNRHLSLSAKINGTQTRRLVSPWRMHCVHCGMPKGTYWAEAMSNSEKIKPVALLSYTCLKASVIQTVTRKFCWMICTSNSMGSSEIWDKYHKCCVGVGKNFTRQSRVKFTISNTTRVVFIPNFTAIPMLFPVNTILHTRVLCYKHVSTLIDATLLT